MKRFAVFAFNAYYPCGGWSDLRVSCETYQEAEDFVNSDHRYVDDPGRKVYEYYQIVDLDNGRVTELN